MRGYFVFAFPLREAPELSDAHMRKLVDLWTERFEEIQKTRKSNTYSFLKTGEKRWSHHASSSRADIRVLGNSEKDSIELDSCKEYYEKENRAFYVTCIKTRLNSKKSDIRQRFFYGYPSFLYGISLWRVYLLEKHLQNLSQMNDKEKTIWAAVSKER